MSQKNLVPNKTGLLIADPRPEDWMAGAETGIAYEEVIKDGDWTKWLPSNERQSNSRFDTFACVSYSLLNSFETQMKRLIREDIFTIHEQQAIQKLGFIDDAGNFNCSDRFLAKMSNTGPRGNYLNIVADTLRKAGAVPENDWPFPSADFDRNKYYEDVSFPVQDKGLEILKFVDLKWEWVSNDKESLKKHLKQAPLQIATAVCPGWSAASPVPSCQLGVSHATLLYNIDDLGMYFDFDHYPPFRKFLASDYRIPFVLKLVVTHKAQVPPPSLPSNSFSYNFSRDIVYGERKSDEVRALQKALKLEGLFPLKIQETGNYYEYTRRAVEAFQRKYKVAGYWELLFVKGRRAGPKTRKKLNELYAPK